MRRSLSLFVSLPLARYIYAFNVIHLQIKSITVQHIELKMMKRGSLVYYAQRIHLHFCIEVNNA